MSSRWFFSSARVGAGAAAAGPTLATSVTFTQVVEGQPSPVRAPGPALSLVGPGDVAGFDRVLVVREEPPPGSAETPENIMASVEFAHADLPWLLSPGQVTVPSGPTPLPWIALVVLAEEEAAAPRNANPLPVLTAPVAALPPLGERWAWTHVEARLDDDVPDVASAQRLASEGVRSRSAGVVARLLCPRKLNPDRTWIAAVVPATAGGVDAGLNRSPTGPAAKDAWPGAEETIDLPVYHWWSFRTGKAGTFEELARRLRFRPAAEAGLGTRTVDVTRPWPAEDPTGPATVAIDGALRVPASAAAEVWSDPSEQDRFRAVARKRLDAPAQRREAEAPQPAPDRDTVAVAPPLYGSHHTGEQTVPSDPDSWMTTLNLEVRRRVAAALGARYVQLEQEFLMARAWEQLGEIRQANRLLAATELATAAAEQSQHKHLGPLPVADLVTAMAPVGNRVQLSTAGLTGTPITTTLATALATSTVPTGAASTAFARLTRRGGALARRAGRLVDGGGEVESGSVIEQGLIDGGMISSETGDTSGLPDELRARISPLPLQLRRMADRIPTASFAADTEDALRPLGPIMEHPRFVVPIAEELLARWPEWAIPGIGAFPQNSVTLLETNPEFVAALLVGLNHEFNRELLWREFPTDQRGTSFARFWPSDGADVDEIARWPLDDPLGSQVRTGGEGNLALLVHGELLSRFPGTAVLAVRGEEGQLPEAFAGIPATPLPLDESTVLYLFAGIDEDRARAEDWFFVFREPMRGTQFGFDIGPAATMKTWADLTWDAVSLDAGRFVKVTPAPPKPAPPKPGELPRNDPAEWGRDAADMARIAFQQPFQLAFRATALLGT